MTRPERINVLRIRIDLNFNSLVDIDITNIGHPAGGDLDLRKYRWEAKGPGVDASGTLDHRRSLGAVALVDKVLDEVAVWMPLPVR